MLLATVAVLALVGLTPGAGAESPPPDPAEAERIVGGTVASPGEYPYQVGLISDPNDPWTQFCGGSLIHPRWVLTAAHCVTGPNVPQRFYVFAGQYDLDARGDVVGVSSIRVHPSYNPSLHRHDVALLRLGREASGTLARLVRPNQSGLYPPGSLAIVTGWGNLLGNGVQYPTKLHEVAVPVVSDATCGSGDYYGSAFHATSMICAGQTGKDSCQGDSGGPLVVGPTNNPLQFGVVSWGIGCAAVNKPGVYARLTTYWSWILGNIGQPATDGFGSAATSPCRVGTATTDNAFATRQTGEPTIVGRPGGGSVWRRFTAPANGTLTVTTMGSEIDTTLGIFTGGAPNALTLVAENDDAPSSSVLQSRVEIPVTQGTTYRIAADGFNWDDGLGPWRGRVRFNWSFAPNNGYQFTDIPASHPFYDDIEFVANEGITTGYGDCTYRPSTTVDRQAMAAFFYRMAGWQEGYIPDGGFPDVKPSHGFFREINWMVAEGVTGGYGDGRFRPTEPVTRQSMAAFFYRLAGSPRGANPTCTEKPFPDVAIDNTFCGEIDWFADTGITGGYADGKYRPLNPVGRQAMAKFMRDYVD